MTSREIEAFEKRLNIKKKFIRDFENNMQTRVFPFVSDFVREELIRNMTDYNHAGVEPRSKDLKMIFDVLNDLFGFEFNLDGSFTIDGAHSAVDSEYEKTGSFSGKFGYLNFRARGRLAQLENGETDWSNLRTLFNKEGVKIALIGKYGIGGYLQVKKSIDNLFERDSVPKRPYLKKAWERGESRMHSEIISMIEDIEGVRRE